MQMIEADISLFVYPERLGGLFICMVLLWRWLLLNYRHLWHQYFSDCSDTYINIYSILIFRYWVYSFVYLLSPIFVSVPMGGATHLCSAAADADNCLCCRHLWVGISLMEVVLLCIIFPSTIYLYLCLSNADGWGYLFVRCCGTCRCLFMLLTLCDQHFHSWEWRMSIFKWVWYIFI